MVVNGKRYGLDGNASRSLLGFLRGDLGLTGAKPGCGEGACGACTVLVDGVPALACQTRLGDVVGSSITTIEGLAVEGCLHPVQQALAEDVAFQCGYCTPGMILRAAALLSADPDPDCARIIEALEPNLCRCGCYPRLIRAVQRAAALMSGSAGPAAMVEAPPDRPTLDRPRRPWDLCEPAEREWFDLLGDGLVVVWPPPVQPEGMWPRTGGAWLHIAPSGLVTAFSGKVDVGQDNETAFRLLVAEELGVDLADVRMVLGDTDVCPFDMGTFGSRSMPDAGEALRRAAAGARQLLAGMRAGGSGGEDDGDAGGGAAAGRPARHRPDLSGLLAGIRQVEIVGVEPALTPPTSWRLAGQAGHGAYRRDVVTGERRYVSDMDRTGLLHGAVLRPPVRGATLARLDLGPAQHVTGAAVVSEGDFAGVVAADPMTARRAVALFDADWLEPPPGPDDLTDYLRSHPMAGEGWERAIEDAAGDVEAALAEAAIRLESSYTTAYISHTPLETRAAVAEWEGNRLTVWTGSQVPFGVRSQLAAAFDLDEADVRVIVGPTGGGFGGKHGAEVATEAARLARAAGKPVKVHWSRAEEFLWGRARPMAVIDVRAGLDGAGAITAWDFLDVNAGAAGMAMPYRVPNRRLRYQPAESPIAQSSYRALAASANHFARESHVDDLAGAAGVDPLEFRLAHLDDERLAAVARAAAERFGWPAVARSPGRGGAGIAVGLEKGGRIATCAQVEVTEDETVQVTRIVTAYECGAVVNPDTVINQIEGATVMALGGALFEEVTIEHGTMTETSLTSYRVPRIADAPAIEVVLLNRPDVPAAGAGETPLVAVAPAIANAIFAACGRRLRSLPLLPRGRLPAAGDGEEP